ncbi:TonB-dependent receptor [Acidovorax sp. GBBC 3334]|uniref:TonB-dependent siderophore receptor n=1 Tax=Acidovorax sp. GBBC 3334 TaxID=2940496 RepID=UPI0023023E36|nr:TonB-dependent receptor [Acidovorax sp. GBBC 3334]MDA8454400.1 TonB-dependent receptor [Acidovorax sp. GBBC 3334]
MPCTRPACFRHPSRAARRRRLVAAGLASLVQAIAASQAQAQAPAAAVPEAQLPATEVVGRQQSGQYHAQESEGATKTETPALEVPQAVRVVTRQFVDDLGALRLDDVLDYVAGVSRQNNFGGTWDNIAMRGFVGHEDMGMGLLRNGMPANRGFNAPRDTANVERFEFLKGTMGALYGNSEPGGTVNVVTKAPLWRAAHSVEAYYGSHDARRLALDTTGPIGGSDGEPARLAYRLNVSVEDKDSFRDFVRSRRELVAPAFTWKLAPDTVLRYDGEWLRQRAPLDRGVVSVNGRLGAVPTSRFYGEPRDGDITVDNQTHQFFLEQALSADWNLRAGLQYKRGTLSGLASEPHQYGPAPCQTSVEASGWLCRRLIDRDFRSNDTTVQVDLNGRFATGALRHELLVGAEVSRFRMDQTMMTQAGGGRFAYGIGVFDPVYGAAQRPALTAAAIDRTVDDRTTAFYVQDQIALTPQWKLLAGLRHDRYRGEIDERSGGGITRQEPSATSPRLGLTWLAQPNLAVYASVGKSFRAQAQTTAAGQAIAPEIGTAREAGVKWESADQRLGGNVAVFDIRKRNMATWDDDGVHLVPLPGTVRNKGLEAELAGWVTPGWRVALSYTYLDADPQITQFARQSASAFVTHERAAPGGGLLGVGAGVTHVGERRGDTGEPRLPAYTIAKLTAYWNVDRRLRVSLDVDNLFDKTYYHSAYNRVWVMPGSPRQVTLGLQYKF